MLILFGPGETKRRFFNFLAKEFNEKITVLEGIDVAGEDGIFVSLRSTSLKELLKASKIGIVSSMLFFFLAEDGIRDGTVTGVQTCALPISRPVRRRSTHRTLADGARRARRGRRGLDPALGRGAADRNRALGRRPAGAGSRGRAGRERRQIGRASCRGRTEGSVDGVWSLRSW